MNYLCFSLKHSMITMGKKIASLIHTTSALFNKFPALYYGLILLLGIIPLFYNLGGPVLNLWDESRRAMNAWEMYHNKNFLVTFFNGEPEMWGTKPPLLIWLQVLSIRIFGLNEWALRFPSALAGLFTGFFILWFTKRYAGSYAWGIVSVLILYSSNGYISEHSVRTADFDSLLVLFTTTSSLLFFLGIENKRPESKNPFILLFFLSVALSFLTKGIAALLFAPAWFIYLWYRKELKNWLENKYLWLGLTILILVIGGYYLLRDLQNPGYLKAIYTNEIAGRYFETLEQNRAPVYFYFKILYQLQFKTWYFIVPLGFLFSFLSKDLRIRRLVIYLTLLTIVHLVIISFAKTKLIWYDLPVIPLISMIGAVFFMMFIKLINTTNIIMDNALKHVFPLLVLLVFFAAPFFDILKKNHQDIFPSQDPELHTISAFLRKADQGLVEMDRNSTILYQGQYQHFLFYISRLEQKGYSIDYRNWTTAETGQKYIIYQPKLIEIFDKTHNVE
ncbi:MAG: glycosyltransferase family 39 protein, partial [Bacteroidales bacterium]|nr:glycosyltransferase family 39 protein [Bacteroidales bacterium]